MWRIRDWDKHFEVSQSRRCPDAMKWVPIPNKQDGDGYTELMDHPNGTTHFGAWTALVQLASKCKPRGTLARDGGKPHDIGSISRITRVPTEVLEQAIPRLISPVGWLEEVAQSGLGADSERATTTLQDKTLQDKTEQSVSASADALDGQLHDWLGWWNRLHDEGLVHSRANEERPTEAVRTGWKRCQRSREVRELLAQRPLLEDRIRHSTFLREGWFRLEILFGGKNRGRELIVRKVLEGAYCDQKGGSPDSARSFNPDATPKPVKDSW